MNADIRKWGKGAIGDLKQEFARLNIVHDASKYKGSDPGASVDKLLNRFGKRQGLIDKVSFKFPRHMVFVHKGTSKGHPISNPRKVKEWFNPVMDRDVEGLADIVAENLGDLITSNLQIK